MNVMNAYLIISVYQDVFFPILARAPLSYFFVCRFPRVLRQNIGRPVSDFILSGVQSAGYLRFCRGEVKNNNRLNKQ